MPYSDKETSHPTINVIRAKFPNEQLIHEDSFALPDNFTAQFYDFLFQMRGLHVNRISAI
jgi:hypothetical protein